MYLHPRTIPVQLAKLLNQQVIFKQPWTYQLKEFKLYMNPLLRYRQHVSLTYQLTIIKLHATLLLRTICYQIVSKYYVISLMKTTLNQEIHVQTHLNSPKFTILDTTPPFTFLRISDFSIESLQTSRNCLSVNGQPQVIKQAPSTTEMKEPTANISEDIQAYEEYEEVSEQEREKE